MRRAGLWVFVGMAVACSSDVTESNLAACERYRDAMLAIECGDNDLASLFPEDYCSDYETVMCDMAPYFDCLQGSAQCDADGVELNIDATGCQAEANCDG